jgi:hypothetical protein
LAALDLVFGGQKDARAGVVHHQDNVSALRQHFGRLRHHQTAGAKQQQKGGQKPFGALPDAAERHVSSFVGLCFVFCGVVWCVFVDVLLFSGQKINDRIPRMKSVSHPEEFTSRG